MSTRGIAQVVDDMGNPLVTTGDSRFLALRSLHLSSLHSGPF